MPSQVKAGISAAHLGDDEAAERHFAVLRDLGVDANGDLYLSVADSLVTLGRPKDATPYLQVGTPFLVFCQIPVFCALQRARGSRTVDTEPGNGYP